jgi:hypothetical protein
VSRQQAGGLSRQQALDAAAAIIARDVVDLTGLALPLADGGLGRLAGAPRARSGARDRPAAVVGLPQPEPTVWVAQARHVIGGGR